MVIIPSSHAQDALRHATPASTRRLLHVYPASQATIYMGLPAPRHVQASISKMVRFVVLANLNANSAHPPQSVIDA